MLENVPPALPKQPQIFCLLIRYFTFNSRVIMLFYSLKNSSNSLKLSMKLRAGRGAASQSQRLENGKLGKYDAFHGTTT